MEGSGSCSGGSEISVSFSSFDCFRERSQLALESLELCSGKGASLEPLNFLEASKYQLKYALLKFLVFFSFSNCK